MKVSVERVMPIDFPVPVNVNKYRHFLRIGKQMTKRTYRIFVSHSSKDTKMIDLVTLAFKNRDVAPFFARRVMMGKNPVEKIIAAIDSSLALFVLMTPDVVYENHTRDWVVFEIGVARTKGIPIFCWMDGNVAKHKAFPKLIENITDYDTFDPNVDDECFRIVHSMVDKAFDTMGIAARESRPSARELEEGLIQMEEARGSTGNIHINTKAAPSPLVTVKLGERLSLCFGHVTWSGGQVDLYISTDGYASLTIPGDTRFGPTFTVADIRSSSLRQIAVDDLLYTVGRNWIKGAMPEALEIPGGDYYIKAFDGSLTTVAVTDNYFKIQASFEVVPGHGPAQSPIELEGFALPPNDSANLSYHNGTGWITIRDSVPANDLGRFVYSMTAPYQTSDTIAFRMIVKSTGQILTATFRRTS